MKTAMPFLHAWRRAFFALLAEEGVTEEIPTRGVETMHLLRESVYVSVKSDLCHDQNEAKQNSSPAGTGPQKKDFTTTASQHPNGESSKSKPLEKSKNDKRSF